MDKQIIDAYINILREELVPAMGCTEPIAVAYAAAVARFHLGAVPTRVEVQASGNIIKNVKSVFVPGTGGMRGIFAAAAAGIVAGNHTRQLEVISGVTPAQIEQIKTYLASTHFSLSRTDGGAVLDLIITVFSGTDRVLVRITGCHTNIVRIEKNGEIILDKPLRAESENGTKKNNTSNNAQDGAATSAAGDTPLSTDISACAPSESIINGANTSTVSGITKSSALNEAASARSRADSAADNNNDINPCLRKSLCIKDIVEFADCVDTSLLSELLDKQIECNMAIARRGLAENFGACIGKILLRCCGDDVHNKAKAYAAAGSDARMNGCELPVVINSGSGNQGITASVPVIIFAQEKGASDEMLYRALTLSNLVTIHLKSGIGKLSAYCGVISAGCGAAAGIAYLSGGRYDLISQTVINGLAINSGVICDGAKPSCAAKIASAVDGGLLGLNMALCGSGFLGGDGIVAKCVEDTISNISTLATEGMRATDLEIIKIMVKEK